MAQATNYADLAVSSDRYNPAALTNKGNTVFANGDYEKAAEFYKEALRNDCSCTEALYNLGKPNVLLWLRFLSKDNTSVSENPAFTLFLCINI